MGFQLKHCEVARHVVTGNMMTAELIVFLIAVALLV